jgi:hypothetical protein
VSKLQSMYCRSCEQTLITDSRDRCDACGSTEVVPAETASEADHLARLVAEKKAEPPRPASPGLFGAIQQIVDTASTAPDVGGLADAEARRHAKYHHRIVMVGGVFTVLGVMLGLVPIAGVVSGAAEPRRIVGILMAPLMFGAGGFVFGMAVTCLVAPTAFLTGPVGRPWMAMIGTRSPAVARIVCAIFGLMVTVPLVALGMLVATAK